jgi:hypothetical protein
MAQLGATFNVFSVVTQSGEPFSHASPVPSWSESS